MCVRRRLAIAVILPLAALSLASCAKARTPQPTRPTAKQKPPETTRGPSSFAPASRWPKIRLVSKYPGFDQPLYLTHAGDGTGRLFVVEKGGRIKVVAGGNVLPQPFLDISTRVSTGSEQGLLGLAFAPDFSRRRRFYVDYTDTSGNTQIVRYRVGANPDAADPASAKTVLTVDQPFANHNGGQLAFGPDGFLYIGMGDGGGAGDPNANGQNPDTLLAKILRIDVESAPALSSTKGYSSPGGNPFARRAGYRPEIWALGVRNPWRFSFDRLTGDLYIGDVGQDRYEEIDFEPGRSGGGRNYGWNLYEGTHPFPPASSPKPKSGLTFPVAEYSHAVGQSVTGGFVYRGTAYPNMRGVYFYGDFGSGTIWGLRRIGGRWRSRVLATTHLGISSFGEDEAGNLYVTDLNGGGVYLISGK